ncbi:MAG: glycoside hydrolase domain-containing protein [Bacilli bacterium]
MPTLQGIDTISPITDSLCSAAAAKGAQFIGAYLFDTDLAGHIGSNEANLTTSAVSKIHSAGLKVVSIATFESATDTSKWTKTEGMQNGARAADVAHTGLAEDVIYFDIEGSTSADSDLVAYLEGVHEGLATTISGHPYHLGIYTSPSNALYLQGTSFHTEVAMWWIAAYNSSGPWYEQLSSGSSNIWQYSGSGFSYGGTQYSSDLDQITNSNGYGGW